MRAPWVTKVLIALGCVAVLIMGAVFLELRLERKPTWEALAGAFLFGGLIVLPALIAFWFEVRRRERASVREREENSREPSADSP